MTEFPLHNSPYFDVREFVDERTWRALGEMSASLIDPMIVRVFDLLREAAGPIVVNNWHRKRHGTVFDSSGFRAVWDKTGGQLSQHRCGRAGDAKSTRYTPAQLYQIILNRQDEFLAAGLTTIEDLKHTPTWLHLDCRPLVGVWKEFAKPFLIVTP